MESTFAYSRILLAVQLLIFAGFVAVGAYLLATNWQPAAWPITILITFGATRVGYVFYGIIRGPRVWSVSAGMLKATGFDGTVRTWQIEELRRLPHRRAGDSYVVVDKNGIEVFRIWMFVSRYEELLAMIGEQGEQGA